MVTATTPDQQRFQVRADADRQRTVLRQALDAQIASLTRARTERAETDLDTARAQVAHVAAPGQTVTGTAPRS